DPTPTIGMVGLIDDERHITTQWFKSIGDKILLVGEIGNAVGGSQFLKICHGIKQGPPPHVDLEEEMKVQRAVRDLIRQALVKSAHDCSEGGLAVALAECCFNPDGLLGAEVDLGNFRVDTGRSPVATEEILFNESQSRIVISVAAENLDKTMSRLQEGGVPHLHLGEVTGDELRIRANNETFRWPVVDIYDHWWNSIQR